MPTNGVSTVLRFIRKVASGNLRLTDRDLLRRFADHREEAAFEVLMARHGPMVMSVCRRILSNWHDAEEACQATFLVLAKKSGSHRWQDSVANWLYKTAYQTALRARTAAVRRSRHERRVPAKTPPNPLVEITGQELLGVLDDELLKVPERFRAPLVLCYLEGLTRDEAARQLVCPLGTLKRRLQRGRDLLHTALVRRGLTLSAGLATIMLTQGTSKASISTLVVRQTVEAALLLAAGKSASGIVSAKVIQLLKGEFMMATKLKGALAILLAVGVSGGATLVSYPAEANRPAGSSRKQTSKPSGKDAVLLAAPTASNQQIPSEERDDNKAGTINIAGRVLGPDGKPFAGAKLYLKSPEVRESAYLTVSGHDGRFKFTITKSLLDKAMDKPSAADASYQVQVMAVAEGYGCDWLKVDPASKELTLRLVEDLPISGRVLDPDAKPVVGAKLTVTDIAASKGDNLQAYLEALRKGGDDKYAFAKSWAGPLPGQPVVLTTGTDGRFKLAGVGHERIVRLHLEGPAIATADLAVMTRAAAKVGDLYGAALGQPLSANPWSGARQGHWDDGCRRRNKFGCAL